MTTHEASSDLEPLLLCFFACPDHAPHAWRIRGERFFHEDVDAFLHCVFQLLRTESRIAGEHGDVAGTRSQAVDGLLERVESDKLPVLRHSDASAKIIRQDSI